MGRAGGFVVVAKTLHGRACGSCRSVRSTGRFDRRTSVVVSGQPRASSLAVLYAGARL